MADVVEAMQAMTDDLLEDARDRWQRDSNTRALLAHLDEEATRGRETLLHMPVTPAEQVARMQERVRTLYELRDYITAPD